MKILITTLLSSASALHPEKDLVYLPESSLNTEDLLADFLLSHSYDIWIADGSEVNESLLNHWRSQNPDAFLSLVVRSKELVPEILKSANRLNILVAPFPDRNSLTQEAWEEEVFKQAEALYTEGLAAEAKRLVETRPVNSSGKNVVLVGAGIVNLITAEFLANRGYSITVLDACQDPRRCRLMDWPRLGVTSGGGNARMFSYTEADNYNEKGSKIYQDMSSIFRKTVRNGGWDVKDPADFSPEEEDWISTFESIPPWLARIYSENIFRINHESGHLWDQFMQDAPELFEEVEYYPDILRMYVEPVATKAAIHLNNKLGALLKGTSLRQYLDQFPVFEPAHQMDELAGGITVKGFTVNVHPFVARLISRIESLGGSMHWNCRIDQIERNGQDEVIALTGNGERFVADHYVISPGVRGNKLLQGMASENVIQGVLGVWLQIPNLEPKLRNSIKIHRRGHVVEDINITVGIDPDTGEDILTFGGGYGFVGLDRPAPDSPELAALFDELENVARIYFPKAYATAKANGGFYPQGQKKYCIRPFTATGLGVFEMIPAIDGGKLIITGGHNTGGFTQAPAVARAVWHALEGIPDPIHAWFHPGRSRLNRRPSRQKAKIKV